MKTKWLSLKNMDKRTLLLLGVVAVAVGIAVIAFKDEAVHIVCYTIGGLLLLYGAVDIIRYFTGAGQGDSAYRSGLVDGALALGIGLFFILRPEEVSDTFGVIMGIALLIDGLFKLQFAVDMMRAKFKFGQAVLGLAVAAMALGVITLAVRNMAVIWVGILLVIDGLCDIAAVYFLNQFDKSLRQPQEN